MGLIQTTRNRYRSTSTISTETEILAAAEDYLRRRFERAARRSAPSALT
jgi:hypothetical protein